jgi:cobalamin biosynthesis Mg chelatase CobN
LRDFLDATTDGEKLTGNDPVLHIKISYDDFDQTTKSKELELEQIEKEIENAKSQIQSAQQKSSSNPTKDDEEEEEEEGTKAKPAAKSTAKKSSTRKSSGGGDKKKTKKSTSSSRKDRENNDESNNNNIPDLEPTEPGRSWWESISEASSALSETVSQHRAIPLFVVASVAIYFFGENASV